MKNTIIFLLVVFFLIGCSKEVTQKENKTPSIDRSTEKSSVVNETSTKIDDSKETNEENEEQVNVPIEEEKQEVPSLNIGEAYSDDNLEVTIQKVEYVAEGIRVYLDVFNKSDTPLEGTGGLQFKLDDPLFEQEFNNLGYAHYFNKNLGYVYKGEKRNGYYLYLYDRDVKIKEIEYFLMESGMKVKPIAKWIIN